MAAREDATHYRPITAVIDRPERSTRSNRNRYRTALPPVSYDSARLCAVWPRHVLGTALCPRAFCFKGWWLTLIEAADVPRPGQFLTFAHDALCRVPFDRTPVACC